MNIPILFPFSLVIVVIFVGFVGCQSSSSPTLEICKGGQNCNCTLEDPINYGSIFTCYTPHGKPQHLKMLVKYDDPIMRTFPETLPNSNRNVQHLDVSMNYLMSHMTMLLWPQNLVWYLDPGSNHLRLILESLVELSGQIY